MPYEIDSPQQMKVTAKGSIYLWGDERHTGEIVYVSQGYRERGHLIWRQLHSILGDSISSHICENDNEGNPNFMRL